MSTSTCIPGINNTGSGPKPDSENEGCCRIGEQSSVISQEDRFARFAVCHAVCFGCKQIGAGSVGGWSINKQADWNTLTDSY